MDQSMIPRPFSPMDGLRAEEANAREMERRTSARNAQTSSIGAGGKLELAGGIEVEDGGNIDVLDGGVITVLGKAFTDAGVPYEVFSRLSTYKNEGNYGTYSSPGIAFGSSIFGDQSGEGARIFTRGGDDVWVEGGDPEVGQSTLIVNSSIFAAAYSRDPVLGPFDERSSRLNLFSDDGFFLSFADSLASTFSRVRSAVGGFLKMESSSPTGTSSLTMDGSGNIDLAASGALRFNGQPIGGATAWGDVTGKPSTFPPSAHTHSINDVTGLSSALNGLSDKTAIAHAEFTASFGLPSGSSFTTVPSWSADAAKTENGGFASAQTSGIIRLNRGVYAIMFTAGIGGPFGSGGVLQMINPATGQQEFGQDVVATSWDWYIDHPAFFAVSNPTDVQFQLRQLGGSSRTCNARIIFEKNK